MSIYQELFRGIELPKMVHLHQEIDRVHIDNVEQAVKDELARSGLLSRIKAGQRVALTAGSREIANYALILKTIIGELKAIGASPFIIPAMGSHGGAIAENQTALIAHFGITEEAMGVPILSSMETVDVGVTPHGVPVYFDKNAASADAIIPVGRIKIHTCFHGKIESGLMKMLAVGCSKQHGAAAMHAHGFHNMCQNVTEVARVNLAKLPIVFGFGILENACHQTRGVYAIPAEEMEQRENEILEISRAVAPRIPYNKIDMLFVDEIGKNISGTGMDPNITGRSSPLGKFEPNADRVAVFDLTDASDGSAYGVGNADIITRRLFNKIIFENTIPNGITNRDLKPLFLPAIMDTDKDAIFLAAATVPNLCPTQDLDAVWLHNTLCMEDFYISEHLAKTGKLISPAIVDWNDTYTFTFDDQGNVIRPKFLA